MITPKDIESKVFGSSLRGYKKEEVDQFLDEIMIDYQKLLDENEQLQKNVRNMESEIAECKKSEKSVLKTLEQAKNLMSDISASAEKRADAIVQNAHAEANRIRTEAQESAAALKNRQDALREKIDSYQTKYKQLLMSELAKLKRDENDLFGELKEDFYPASMVTADEDTFAEIEEIEGMTAPDAEAPAEPEAPEVPETAEPEAPEEPAEEEHEQTLTEQVLKELNGEDYVIGSDSDADEIDRDLNSFRETASDIDDKASTIIIDREKEQTKIFEEPLV